jgi:hypothetical protein
MKSNSFLALALLFIAFISTTSFGSDNLHVSYGGHPNPGLSIEIPADPKGDIPIVFVDDFSTYVSAAGSKRKRSLDDDEESREEDGEESGGEGKKKKVRFNPFNDSEVTLISITPDDMPSTPSPRGRRTEIEVVETKTPSSAVPETPVTPAVGRRTFAAMNGHRREVEALQNYRARIALTVVGAVAAISGGSL